MGLEPPLLYRNPQMSEVNKEKEIESVSPGTKEVKTDKSRGEVRVKQAPSEVFIDSKTARKIGQAPTQK